MAVIKKKIRVYTMVIKLIENQVLIKRLVNRISDIQNQVLKKLN